MFDLMQIVGRFVVVGVTTLLGVGSLPFTGSTVILQKSYVEPYLDKQISELKSSLQAYLDSKVSPASQVTDKTGLTPLTTDTQIETITKEIVTYVATSSALPTGDDGSTLYLDDDEWIAGTNLFNNGNAVGVGTKDPRARFHVISGDDGTIGLIVQGANSQSALLADFRNGLGTSLANFSSSGKLTIAQASNDHSIELQPTGNAGYLSSSGGAFFLNNTSNIGSGIGIYSNAGSEALGNMINVKVDNPLYNQAAFYMNYDGISNAVEIVSNTNDDSSNALSITNNNTQDSALGVIGYETGKGTIKVSHNGTGSDSNASGVSIDLKGTGTRAQGLYVDSTASGGTLGNLLRLRNQSVDRFVVNSVGSLALGGYGTDTSITKYGNTTGDQFFVGTNGAFRVQRSATDSEAFRVQINGDTQGRWLGTSDGKLKWGDGTNAQDIVLRRSSAGVLLLDTATLTLNSGNLGVGTTSFGTSGAKILAIGNGTAPSTSITDGIQLYAIDYDDADGSSTSELFVRDEDGNATNLSPHNFSLINTGPSESLAWAYYSEKNGQAINVDMAKAMRIIEQLSGEKLIYKKDLATGQDISLATTSTDSPLQSYMVGRTQPFTEHLSKEEDILKKSDLNTHLFFADNLITILQDLVIKTQTTFEQSVEFLARVVFKETVTFEQGVAVKGKLDLSSNNIGKAVIRAGDKQVSVNFPSVYEKEPIVTVTATDLIKGNYWVNKTNSGFTILVSESQDRDIGFDWHAFGSGEEIQKSESSGDNIRISPIPEITISSTKSSASVAGVASNSATTQ